MTDRPRNERTPYQTRGERIAELERELAECRERLPSDDWVAFRVGGSTRTAPYNPNVRALTELLTEYLRELENFHRLSSYVPTTPEQEADNAAHWLASRGVLAVESLSDDQAFDL